MRRTGLAILVSMMACTTGTDTTDTTGDPGVPQSGWHVAADEVEGGVMLSAVELGGTIRIAGGSYETTGSLWQLTDTGLCVEREVAEKALWWVHGRSETNWYAVGEDSIVVHEVDGARTREDLGQKGLTLFGLYDDGSAAWTVGGYARGDGTGEVWRKIDGGSWELLATTPGLAFKTWEGWVVGDGFVWWWNEAAGKFEDRTPEGEPRLLTARGPNPDTLFAVGGVARSEFHFWQDGAWTQPKVDPFCAGQPLNGVYVDAEGSEAWVAGNYGTAASFNDGVWTCADFPVTSQHFHAAWKLSDQVLFLGGNLFATEGHVGTIGRYSDGEVPGIAWNGDCP